MRLHQLTNYSASRNQHLRAAEGEPQHQAVIEGEPGLQWVRFAYVDSEGIATIGVGMNLQIHTHFILRELGLDVEGTALSGGAEQAERGYIERLIRAINVSYTADNTDGNAALAVLNGILLERAQDSAYDASFVRRTEFSLTVSESTAALDAVLEGYSITLATGAVVQHVGTEDFVSTQLQRSLSLSSNPSLISGLLILDNEERIALVSLAYNAESLLGPRLRRAIENDDRAEAWYEIRYRSNAQYDQNNQPIGSSTRQGIANRRYQEAELFGLYNDQPNMEDF